MKFNFDECMGEKHVILSSRNTAWNTTHAGNLADIDLNSKMSLLHQCIMTQELRSICAPGYGE